MSIYFIWVYLIHLLFMFDYAHWNKYTGLNPVSVTLEYLMIHGSAIHIAYRILAAFFIDMGAKTSIVENLVFIQPFIYLYYFFIFVQIIKIISNFNYNYSVY